MDTGTSHVPAPGAVGSVRYDSITKALHATLDPRVSNDVRQQALHHLEQVKLQPDAPSCGFSLCEDTTQNNGVRYYGLQLLDYAVRYRWADCAAEEREQLRKWIITLAQRIREEDALFLRNKIAQLWSDMAKRCWGGEWMDMDSQLVDMWDLPVSGKGMVHKIFVLYVLETLSEDIVNREDHIAGLRLDILRNGLNEILMPNEMYHTLANIRNGAEEMRHSRDGWLAKIFSFFSQCVKELRAEQSPELITSLSACAIKALNALRPTATWISVMAVVETGSIDCLFLPFFTEDVVLCTAATEVLYALLHRPHGHMWHNGWEDVFRQMLQPERVELLRNTFQMAHSNPGEHDEKYTLQKKLSDLLSVLADGYVGHPDLAASVTNSGTQAFFALLQQVLQSQSLTVSIPILYSFTRLINVEHAAITDLVFQAFGALMNTCSSRLLRYEALADDSDDNTVQFLLQDFDTLPEQHAFLGNYRRYCVTILQSITRLKPQEALAFVLEQMKTMLATGPYTGARGFDSANYSKNGIPVLQFDAQLQVVSGALKGFSLWSAEINTLLPENEALPGMEAERNDILNMLQQWCHSVINIHTDDPEVAAQVLETLVLILQTIKQTRKPEPAFVLQVVQHLLTMRLYDNPAHQTFSEAVKAFEGLRVFELQKLTMHFSSELLDVYHELEPRIGVLAQKHQQEPRQLWGYRAFLLMVIHRAPGIEREVRLTRLQTMLQPVYDAWQDPALEASLANFESFCASLGVASLPEFYKGYHFDRVADWSRMQLDQAGQMRQNEIKEKAESLPLRMTKALLGAMTEKVKPGTDYFESACVLWGPLISVILPKLLQMLRYAQAFYSTRTWAHLPNDLQLTIRRTLQDRFWQAGISNESKDEFYARISGSKTSYEGFASSVRATMRAIREQGYHVLYLLSKFDEQFYGLSELAMPLAEALYDNADALSPSQLQSMINLTTGLVHQCPPHRRAAFLPPLLIQLFHKIDPKIQKEWNAVEQANQTNREEDALGDEMRSESVLRQLTYGMMTFVMVLLGPDNSRSETNNESKPTLASLVLANTAVLEPLLVFCTHVLRVRDSRCCATTCRVLRGLIPLFAGDHAPSSAAQVREFIAEEVLKTSITSLNESYFTDVQKDLAMLIAQIIVYLAPKSDTPRRVLASLPSMPEARVESTLTKIWQTTNERQQRAIVLELLEGVRGISIYEQGKMPKESKQSVKSSTQQRYMDLEQPPVVNSVDETGLDGVAGLFDGT